MELLVFSDQWVRRNTKVASALLGLPVIRGIHALLSVKRKAQENPDMACAESRRFEEKK